jgi:hypothetical protein
MFASSGKDLMAVLHKKLSQEKWSALERSQQVLNISAELSRARRWLGVNDEYLRHSLERALELMDLTVEDRDKWVSGSLREMLRLREVLAQYLVEESKSESELKQIIRALLCFDRTCSTIRP